eukprot:3475841-Pyramimonas_sp.AAC.1
MPFRTLTWRLSADGAFMRRELAGRASGIRAPCSCVVNLLQPTAHRPLEGMSVIVWAGLGGEAPCPSPQRAR